MHSIICALTLVWCVSSASQHSDWLKLIEFDDKPAQGYPPRNFYAIGGHLQLGAIRGSLWTPAGKHVSVAFAEMVSTVFDLISTAQEAGVELCNIESSCLQCVLPCSKEKWPSQAHVINLIEHSDAAAMVRLAKYHSKGRYYR